jgi:type I restriction enzyme R subunit
VLYLTRKLKEHTLLQAIARVNRLHEGKDYGYVIDYRGVLESLDHALDLYKALPEFDMEDLEGMMTDVHAVIEKLPQKQSELWDIFKDIPNKRDEEAFERLLADDALRVKFYEKFSEFAKTLGIALSTVSFLENTSQKKIDGYHRDLAFFRELRSAVRRRYAEVIDFSEYEPKIKKLLDTNLRTEGVEQITGAIDLLNEEQRAEAMSECESDAAKADVIAHNTKRVLEVKWKHEDPAFYEKFSKMIQNIIDAFRAGRLKEAEYLKKSQDVEKQVLRPSGEDVPAQIRDNEIATTFFRNIYPIFEENSKDSHLKGISAEASLAIANIINENRIVNWVGNTDCQNRMRQYIDDYLFDLKDRYQLNLTIEDVDLIMDRCLEIAKVRLP